MAIQGSPGPGRPPAGGDSRDLIRPGRPAASALETTASPNAADVLIGVLSLAATAAVRTGTVAAGSARSAVGRVPTPRIRIRSGMLNSAVRILDEQGRFVRAALGDRVRDVGSAALTSGARAVLGHLDLTELVREFVDLDGIVSGLDVDAVVARVDFDLVIDQLDIPALLQETTGSVTAEMVRDMRAQSLDADRLVERTVDRLLLRRSGRRLTAEPAPEIRP
jgi:hypothetical protein